MVHYCLELVLTRDYFCCLQSYHRPVNYLSTAVQFTNRLLRFRADGGFVYYKRVNSPSFLVWSQSLIIIITSWFAIALDEIRTRRILKESLGILLVSMKHYPRQNSCFELQHLNFTAEFKILHFFSITGKQFYPCLSASELNFFI